MQMYLRRNLRYDRVQRLTLGTVCVRSMLSLTLCAVNSEQTRTHIIVFAQEMYLHVSFSKKKLYRQVLSGFLADLFGNMH